jgi:hypothetical protein
MAQDQTKGKEILLEIEYMIRRSDDTLTRISLATLRLHKCHVRPCPKQWRQVYIYDDDAANQTPQGNAKQSQSIDPVATDSGVSITWPSSIV